MHFLDLTLDRPEENLALDEALLMTAQNHADSCKLNNKNLEPIQTPEQGRESTENENQNQDAQFECVRIWEAKQPFVVLGASSKLKIEARVDECAKLNVPILRRASGGAAIVTGQGCLMYAVVLSYSLRPELRGIDASHQFVMQRLANSIARFVPGVVVDGISDLVHDGNKFSGNALRCKRDFLLYHGTLLYDFPLDLVSQCLGTPPRMPEYRENREHFRFIKNLPISQVDLVTAVREAFGIHETGIASFDSSSDWPRELTAELVREKYSCKDWIARS
jgi:lipoate---protein ligase